ncbi:NFACT family protein, partial [Oceanithermus sp.]
MEGLQIAAVLRELPELPRATLGWRFPAEDTAVLALAGGPELVLRYRPPNPKLALARRTGGGRPRTPFQKQLAARARGPLLRTEQLKLDRVVVFEFGGEDGFVETPPVRLIFELTGRNANLILTDLEGRILGVDRPVGPEQNRYRQVRVGLTWTPPPPYEKLDPRTLAGPEVLRPLVGRPLVRALVRHVDGLGPRLAREVARRAGLEPEREVGEDNPQPPARTPAKVVADPTPREDAPPPNW